MDTFSDKLVVKDGREWCLDVLDRFVAAGQSVSVGEAVVRRYRPVSAGHNHVVLGIYSSDSPDVQVIYWATKSTVYMRMASLNLVKYAWLQV